MKPGILTSEFLLIAAMVVCAIVAMFAGVMPPHISAAVMAGLPAVWAVIRSVAKTTASKSDDELLAKMEELLPQVKPPTPPLNPLGGNAEPPKAAEPLRDPKPTLSIVNTDPD